MGDKTPSTPGSRAIENLKSQESALQLFKAPQTLVRKKPKPKILTEEKYIEEMSNIIQRDFFPHLEKLRAQNEYLDAEARKDYAQMEVIRARYSGRRPSERSTSMTPATFETPSSLNNGTPVVSALGSDTPKSTISQNSDISTAEGGAQKQSISEKHTLDSFLQRYTSEDNQSFQEIIETADQKLRQKFAVLYNEEKLSADKLARALTLPTIEKQFEQPDPLRAIETWHYTNKNSVMYIPDGVELTEAERIEAANHKQSIKHDATRLAVNPFNETHNQKTVAELAKTQNLALSEKLGVDGNPLNAQNKPAPQVRGFELVKTPSPRPGEAFSPLMTWGEIEGTPFRLDGSDTPIRSNAGPSFKINETSRRENIALALAEKAGEKMRAQKQRALDAARKNMSSPFIRSNMERLASMSPAARRLATAKLGLRGSSITPSARATPTPLLNTPAVVAKTTPKASPAIGVVKKSAAAKEQVNAAPSKRNAAPAAQDIDLTKSTLTDDLLKIPTKRLKAADFF